MSVAIAVFNRKGGATKTTAVFNLAGVLAKKYKKKVLVIDTDSQASITKRLLLEDIAQSSSMNEDFFEGKLTFEDLFIHPEKVNDAIYNAKISLRDGFLAKKKRD